MVVISGCLVLLGLAWLLSLQSTDVAGPRQNSASRRAPMRGSSEIPRGQAVGASQPRSQYAEDSIRILSEISRSDSITLSSLLEESLVLQRLVIDDPSGVAPALFEILESQSEILVKSLSALLLGGIKQDPTVVRKLHSIFLDSEREMSAESQGLSVVILYSLGLRDQRSLVPDELRDLWAHRLFKVEIWQNEMLEDYESPPKGTRQFTKGAAGSLGGGVHVTKVNQFENVSDPDVRKTLLTAARGGTSVLSRIALDILARSIESDDVRAYFYERLLTSDESAAWFNLEVLGHAATKHEDIAYNLLAYLDQHIGQAEVTRYAISAFLQSNAPWVFAEIEKRYARLDEPCKLTVLENLRGRFGDSLSRFLQEVSAAGSASERKAVAKCLEKITTPDAVACVVAMATRDPDEEVRRTSLETLAWNKGTALNELTLLRQREAVGGLSEDERSQLKRSVRILSQRLATK